jgi:hypothetical protein
MTIFPSCRAGPLSFSHRVAVELDYAKAAPLLRRLTLTPRRWDLTAAFRTRATPL